MENEANIPELSIVMPCLDESTTVGICVAKAKTFLEENNIVGEVIVADNGSKDDSALVAFQAGAKVVHIVERGYGSALIGGINEANGKYIIIGDADDSYDFLTLMPFVEKLRQGFHLVVGNRFSAKMAPGAMPWLHRYIGNPLLSGIGKLFFSSKISDFHCGLRGFTKNAFNQMDLRTTGMEFASEMIVKATIYDLKITEVPTILSPDGRIGKSHLRSFSDGWRHLQFLFIYSPRWLFLYPGIVSIIVGLVVSLWILPRPVNTTPDVHTMLYAVAAILIGVQSCVFAVFSKTFAVHEKLIPTNPVIEGFFNKFTPQRGIIIGLIMVLLGLGGSAYTYGIWAEGSFFKLGAAITIRVVIAMFTLLVLGFQLIFSSFFYYLLKIQSR